MSWIKSVFKILLALVLSCVFFLLLLYRSDISADEIVSKYQTPESHFISIDGTNIHVRFMGEGEPIFLLHGSFSSLHTWEVWQKELSPYFMTISLDFPGHGLTGPSDQKLYSIQDYSQLVLQLAEKLNLERFHIAGNSMGGAVALEVASTRSDKVLSLNLIDASGAPPFVRTTTDTLSQANKSGGAWIFKLARNPIFSQILLKCTPKFLFAMNMKEVYFDSDKIKGETINRYYELMLREGNRQATLDRLSTPRDASFDFDRLNMPTLITWGENDNWIPVSNAYRFEQVIPGSKLKIFKEAGHVPMEEIPTESVAAYLSFLGVEVRKGYFNPPKLISHVN